MGASSPERLLFGVNLLGWRRSNQAVVALAAARVVCEVLQKPWDVYGDKENFIWTLGQLRPEQRA